MNEDVALENAVNAARFSPCQKSNRGVIVFDRRHGVLGTGWNRSPSGCDGSEQCREICNKICVHAEMDALASFHRNLLRGKWGALASNELAPEMLHVKVVAGAAVPSGEPSCWQCSRHMENFGIQAFWLLHEDGLRRYDPDEFHRLTLQSCALTLRPSGG